MDVYMVAEQVMSPAAVQVAEAGAADRDRREVAALDLAFQDAVKRNNAARIDRILYPDFYLVLGNGTVVSRAEVIGEARGKSVSYEVQDEDPGTQTVRVWGDTAVVTARLRIKGSKDGTAFDRTLWFSDTYVRTPAGWRYVFAQASLPLPASAGKADVAAGAQR